jgi:hypothetical protein
LRQGYFIAGVAPPPLQAEKNNIPLLPSETIHPNRIALLFWRFRCKNDVLFFWHPGCTGEQEQKIQDEETEGLSIKLLQAA